MLVQRALYNYLKSHRLIAHVRCTGSLLRPLFCVLSSAVGLEGSLFSTHCLFQVPRVETIALIERSPTIFASLCLEMSQVMVALHLAITHLALELEVLPML